MTLNRRYSYYYYYDSNKCDDESFDDPSLRLQISTDGVEFFLMLLILLGWLFTLRKSASTRRLLRWYTFGLCLVLYLLALGLGIIDQVLHECHRIGETAYVRMWIAPQFFYAAAELILLGIILLPITQAFLSLVGKRFKIYSIVHCTLLALLVVLALVWNGIYAHINNTFDFTEGDFELQKDGTKVLAAYHTVILFTVLYLSILFIVLFCVGLAEMRSRLLPITGIALWSFGLFFCYFGLSLIRVVYDFYGNLEGHFLDFSFSDSAVIYILPMLLGIGVKISIIGLAAYSGFEGPTNQHVYQTTSDMFEPLGYNRDHDQHEMVRETV